MELQRNQSGWRGAVVGAGIFLTAMTAVTGCQAKKQQQAVEAEAIPVRVMSVKEGIIRDSLDYVGDIKAQEEVYVYPKVSGKVLEKNTHEGQEVAKGDVILYVDRDEVGFTFEKAPVESPIAGIVGRLLVDIGSNVSTSTPVALVVDMDKAQINLSIPELYVPKISVGQEAKIMTDAYPGEIFSGKVSQVSPVLDKETRSAPIEILIDNPDHRLKPGMFAKAGLVMEEHIRALTVLKEAVLGSEGAFYVYVAEDGKARKQTVKTGLRIGSSIEITEGLKANDKIVIMGQQKLIDGANITIEE
ncbi:MAG: efflux RND transporter periplasmic adaptor subunit [Candidatus Omnitrophota bacterium]